MVPCLAETMVIYYAISLRYAPPSPHSTKELADLMIFYIRNLYIAGKSQFGGKSANQQSSVSQRMAE
jgi:hypothetical protein